MMFRFVVVALVILLLASDHAVAGFHPSRHNNNNYRGQHRISVPFSNTAGVQSNDVIGKLIPPRLPSLYLASTKTTETTDTRLTTVSEVQESVEQLKKVLEREYLSFFDPMEREYYADSVTFDDPLNNLDGVDGYQANVDMLAGRTLLGSLLFRDAGIALHSVTGGRVTQSASNGSIEISEITTRWTLRFTFKILPWSPTPRFSGISRYTVRLGGPKGVQIVKQADFWDTINLKPGGADYEACDRAVAVKHFIDLIKPGNFVAPPAGPELPYVTLRIGKGGYEVRRYPSYSAVQMKYERRDEAFTELGAFTSGMSPMSPAIISVGKDDKTMLWPLTYASPGQEAPPINEKALSLAEADPTFEIVTIPEQVVATQRFTGSIVAPVVRQVDNDLRTSLVRDGLQAASEAGSELKFAQYDAVYSMGQRRSEVHIPLQDGGHPW